MMIKKGFDLIAQSFDDDSTAMKKYVKPAKAIKEIKLAWNERLKKQQVEGTRTRTRTRITEHKE